MGPDFRNAGAHNSLYRGKFVGDAVTDAQYAAIAAGTFEELYIGDYWRINNVHWRIAAFDYFLHIGDTETTKHHVVIVPDVNLYSAKMNDTDTTDGAYVGSKMYKEGLSQAKTIVKEVFSDHVLKHRIYLSNAASNGKASAGAWFDSEVDLMCEQMVYGSGIFSPVSDGTAVPNNYRAEKSQLPLFAFFPWLISNRTYSWLRDVISATAFSRISSGGYADIGNSSYSYGVRPYFCIVGN